MCIPPFHHVAPVQPNLSFGSSPTCTFEMDRWRCVIALHRYATAYAGNWILSDFDVDFS